MTGTTNHSPKTAGPASGRGTEKAALTGKPLTSPVTGRLAYGVASSIIAIFIRYLAAQTRYGRLIATSQAGPQRTAELMGDGNGFRIVIGVDGSTESRFALEWALTEARLRHGQVRAVTAWEYPPEASGMEAMIWDSNTLEPSARGMQTDILKGVDTEGVNVTGDVVQGPTVTVLINASQDADLLIVGSRGHGGFTGLLLGSVSTQVLHHAACPVLVVRTRPGVLEVG